MNYSEGLSLAKGAYFFPPGGDETWEEWSIRMSEALSQWGQTSGAKAFLDVLESALGKSYSRWLEAKPEEAEGLRKKAAAYKEMIALFAGAVGHADMARSLNREQARFAADRARREYPFPANAPEARFGAMI